MRRAGIAVDATMLAAAVWIQTVGEPEIRAVVLREDGAGMVDVELRQDVALGLRVLEILSEIVRRLLQGKLFKSVRGIESCPASREHSLLQGLLKNQDACETTESVLLTPRNVREAVVPGVRPSSAPAA